MALRATKVNENAGARRPERPPQAECLPHCPATEVDVVRQEVFDGAPLATQSQPDCHSL